LSDSKTLIRVYIYSVVIAKFQCSYYVIFLNMVVLKQIDSNANDVKTLRLLYICIIVIEKFCATIVIKNLLSSGCDISSVGEVRSPNFNK